MAKKMKKVLAMFLAVSMLSGTMLMATPAVAAEADSEYTIALIPGKTTSAKREVNDENGTTTYTITAETSDITVDAKQTAADFVGPQSALKFDRNDSADQTAQRKVRDLYTDNGHFTDPDTITVTDAPEGYPFQYVGTGDYSGHYVSHIRVIYERDEAGNPVEDPDGNYVIKELQHANGTPLTIDLEPTTSFEGPYDQTTGTRPLQFLLKNEAGDNVYAYCIDVETGIASGDPWYAVANLEDNNYYASQDAEDHVRGIVFNGYWGTEEGTGSLDQLKTDLKAALAADAIESEYDINFRNRVKNSGQELAENQYASANYVYTKLNQKVSLTDEIIDGLTEGEALDAMQCAIWTFANGSNAYLDGTDRMIVGDLSYASSAMGDSRNGANDFEGAARTQALYDWLIQQTASASSVVINDTTFADDITLTLGEKKNGVYDASLSFTIAGYEPGSKDELSVVLTYDGANGEPVTIEEALAGEGALETQGGVYTIGGLHLAEDDPFEFTLNIYGQQYLEKNAYIYTAEGGIGASQTMVGMAEGYVKIDVSKTMNSEFNISEEFEPKETELGELGSKKDELIDRETNRYEVTIEVPGVDGDNRHDEVILMVDGSYSMDNEWPAMKEAINTIGKTVLNGSGTTQLTLMAFGMGDNEVLVHVKDADELASALGELPGNLLYGRSSTNCEAGFDGVANYIENHDETLKDVNVIFVSDGNLNTDETPRAFDTNWKTWATKFGALTVAQAAFEGALTYGENIPAAFNTVFGDRFAGATNNEILSRAFGGEVTDEEFIAFADQVWADVYAYSDLISGVEYPVSVAERAFVKYDKEKGTYIQDAFYYTTYKSSYVTYPDRWTRTPVAADELAAMEEVAAMYVVDYDSYTSWMDTGIKSEKSTFIQSNGIAGLCDALAGALTNLAKTPFNDVVVTDYMSKWVDLDASTLKIIDNNSGESLWTATDGWLIEENVPTEQEPPVVVELVDPAGYAAGGDDVVGNTSGDIYKLTWYVKDGAMLRADSYKLSYEVTVDTKEDGFKYDTDYPANGTTELTYTDENGDKHTNPIKVPDVDAIIRKTNLKVQKVDENGNPLTGAEFKLYAVDVDGNKTPIGDTYAVDENGELTLKLAAGDHLLVETKAPSGYLTAADAIEITVDEELAIRVADTKAATYADGVLTVVNNPPHAAVVLTIDMSGTMYRNKMDGKRYVDVAKAKALEFVEQYADSAAGLNAKRMLSVVCFDTDAKIQQNWIDVSTAAGLSAAKAAINGIKVADNGSASSNQVCTNFDGGVILSRNLLKQDTVSDIDRCFTIILSDGAPTVTVNSDTDAVGTIKSSFWGNQLDANGKKYQNARCGGGWTHPAEVESTLKYLATGKNNLADLTCSYINADGEEKEGIFIVGVGGLMNFKLFYDAVYGTSNGTRTSDVKKKPAAFNNVEALADYSQAEIMKLTTGDWMGILAEKVGGTYESATNTAALQAEFTNILNAIKDTTTPMK